MEENNPTPAQEQSQTSSVSFPQSKKKSGAAKYVFFLIIILILGGLGWFLFGKQSENETIDEVTPTPFVNEEPSPSPEPEIDRSGIKIQVLNGTGLEKAATTLKETLTALGYEEIEAGNASRKDYKVTSVTFASDLSEAVKDDIEKTLDGIYEEVDTDEAEIKDFDIKIITGYPKGHTPTPTVTKTPVKSPTPTTATSSATVSPTKTPTPTP